MTAFHLLRTRFVSFTWRAIATLLSKLTWAAEAKASRAKTHRDNMEARQ